MSILVIGCIVVSLLVYGLADDYMSKTPKDNDDSKPNCKSVSDEDIDRMMTAE